MANTTALTSFSDAIAVSDVNRITSYDILNKTTSNRTMAFKEGCLVVSLVGMLPWQNPEDLVSSEVRRIFYRFQVGLLAFLCFIGTPLNFLNMAVFYKQGLKERINLCLFCLSFADILVVFFPFTWDISAFLCELSGESPMKVYRFFVNNYLIGLSGFVYVSSFMTTVIAMERCYCVLRPLKSKTLIKTRTMAVVIVVAWVLIVGCHFIVVAKWRIVCLFDPVLRVSADAMFSSEFFFENEELVNVFDGIVFGIAFPGLCLGPITVATALTVLNLKKFAAWREQSASSATAASRDVTLTRMLVGISLLFIVCTTPGFIFHTVIPFVPDLSLSGRFYNTFNLFRDARLALAYINSSVNFFVYYAFGSKFRETLRGMLCKSSGRSVSYRQRPAAETQRTVPHTETTSSGVKSDYE